jgi:hypothetical protein
MARADRPRSKSLYPTTPTRHASVKGHLDGFLRRSEKKIAALFCRATKYRYVSAAAVVSLWGTCGQRLRMTVSDTSVPTHCREIRFTIVCGDRE